MSSVKETGGPQQFRARECLCFRLGNGLWRQTFSTLNTLNFLVTWKAFCVLQNSRDRVFILQGSRGNPTASDKEDVGKIPQEIRVLPLLPSD